MIEAVVIGLAGGVVAGLLGVGGGILFVPALTLALGLDQVDAEATSLLAIIPVSALGAYRQSGYGNVRWQDGMLAGALAVGGVAAGVAVANAIDERTLEVGFALLMVFVAARLLKPSGGPPPAGSDDPR